MEVRNEELKRLRFAAGEVRLAKKDRRLLDQVAEVDEEVEEALSAGDKEDAEAATEVRELFGRAGSLLQKLAGHHEKIVNHAKRKIKALVRYERHIRDEEEEEEERKVEAEAVSAQQADDATQETEEPREPEAEQREELPLALPLADDRRQEAVSESDQQEPSTQDDDAPQVAAQIEDADRAAASLVAEMSKTDKASATDEGVAHLAEQDGAALEPAKDDQVVQAALGQAGASDGEQDADSGALLQEQALLDGESEGMMKESAGNMAAHTSQRAAAQLHSERHLLRETQEAEREVRRALRGGPEAAQVRSYVTKLLEGTKHLEKHVIGEQKAILRRARQEQARVSSE